MMQYRGPYRLFRGYWKHIIVPLVLPPRYNHFSFARVTLGPQGWKCTYYDSLLQLAKGEEMRAVYFSLIRAALLHELLKDSNSPQVRAWQAEALKPE